MPLLLELRLLERLVTDGEIGAGILPVVVQHQRIEACVEIVVMRDIALRAPGKVQLIQVPAQPANLLHQLFERMAPAFHHVEGEQVHHLEEIAIDRLDFAVHIGFPQRQRRIEEQAAFCAGGLYVHRGARFRSRTETARGTIRKSDRKGSDLDQAGKSCF